ncbi:MAG: DUF1858 domain-containing protein [Eubacteriales bacterium]|nr:DUF1858 domain-containing protein [Eubacteriales bacterium]
MVTKDMRISEILEMDRNTAPIFMEAGMHCLGCAMASMESMEQACAVHGIDVNALVDRLNEFFDNKE